MPVVVFKTTFGETVYSSQNVLIHECPAIREPEREEASDLQWEYASVHERINTNKIDPEEARRLLSALDVRARKIKMRLAKRMADILGCSLCR
jgi:uncharacterized membrane protein YcjF (UPF0283 family)